MTPPAAPQSNVNGVLPLTVLQKNAPTSAPRGPKASQPRLKLVLRRLPPGLTKSELETVLGEEWEVGSGKVDWVSYRQGKISKDLAKPSRPSRAYFHVTSQAHVAPFGDHVRQTSFNDAARSFQDPALIGPPTLEFAPFHKVPGGRRRNDARQGLIDQDPEFKDFLESLTNPVTKPPAPEASADGQKEEKKVMTTPLIEALREKKANKDKTPSKASGKHARGESQEADKENKKVLGKSGKDASSASTEKGRRMSKAEKAAKEAVKVLNKEAAATAGKDAMTEKSASNAPPAERKRERGNASIAKSMLQRDLGIGPAPNRRRGAKRELTPAASEPGAKPDEKAKEAIPAATPVEKAATLPTSPKKESVRPTRAERRAFKANQAEKSSKGSPEDSKQQNKTAPTAPMILKKPQSSTIAPSQGQAVPSKGSTASKAPPTEPAAARTSTPVAPPTGPAAQNQTTAQASTTPPNAASNVQGRQAFLKHANPSQGITEPLIEAALAVFGTIEKVEIDKRKGFAYVDFADSEGLLKAIAGSPIKVAEGAVQVLERKDKVQRPRLPPPHHHHPQPPTGPARGGRGGFSARGRGRGGGRGGAAVVQVAESNPSTPGSTAPVTSAPAPVPAAAPTGSST